MWEQRVVTCEHCLHFGLNAEISDADDARAAAAFYFPVVVRVESGTPAGLVRFPDARDWLTQVSSRCLEEVEPLRSAACKAGLRPPARPSFSRADCFSEGRRQPLLDAPWAMRGEPRERLGDPRRRRTLLGKNIMAVGTR
ncbi:hypothetical protein GN956_G21555 [Arapaima gigas]